ncbi:MAG: hypothetical protein QM669_00580 [Siphonobacter sp.]
MIHPASFRDPDGFVFSHQHTIYRQVNPSYLPQYTRLMTSGLYQKLTEKGFLVAHQEIADPRENLIEKADYLVLQPEPIPVINYPASWSFRMLQAAALLTLDIQIEALKVGMTLKDASAYNIQFVGIKPVFIDTLSFEEWRVGSPWYAYGQFCRHFLAPLTLLSYVNSSLNSLWSSYSDGIPLPLAAQLLPVKARWNVGLWLHLFLHAKQLNATKRGEQASGKTFSKQDLINLATHLRSLVAGLKAPQDPSIWKDYYENDVEEAYQRKKQVTITSWLTEIQPKQVLDIGANRGQYSRLAAQYASYVIAAEADPHCVDAFWQELNVEKIDTILPLCINAAYPEPAVGWMNEERSAVSARIHSDTVFALALTHHLRITYSIPFALQANWFANLGETLVVEFIPKDDPKVQLLLSTHRNPFDDYSLEIFVAAFTERFSIKKQTMLSDSGRILFWLERKKS